MQNKMRVDVKISTDVLPREIILSIHLSCCCRGNTGAFTTINLERSFENYMEIYSQMIWGHLGSNEDIEMSPYLMRMAGNSLKKKPRTYVSSNLTDPESLPALNHPICCIIEECT